MSRLFNPIIHLLNKSGATEEGTITFYEQGTNTLLGTFQDAALTLANTNPVEANGSGQMPPIYLQRADYTIVAEDSAGGQLWSTDYDAEAHDQTRIVDDITALKALSFAQLTTGTAVYIRGYSTDNDGGQGLFLWDSTSAVADNGGTIIEPVSSPATGRWIRQYSGDVSVLWFGAVGDGTTNDTTAVQNAMQHLRDRGGSYNLTLPVITAYDGGVLFFPAGAYRLDFDTFEIDDILNLTLRGEGSAFEQNFAKPVSRLLFSGTSTGYGLRVVNNGARGFRCENLGIEYADNNFTGTLIELEDLAGFAFRNCKIGHQVDGSRYYTPSSLVNFKGNTKFGLFEQCSFDEADKGVITTAFGGNDANNIKFDLCVFNDLQTAQVEIAGGGEEIGFIFTGCSFDPVNLTTAGTPVVNGLILGGTSWVVSGCIFAGATNNAVPSASYAELSGNGIFEGNLVRSNKTGVITKGVVRMSGNRITALTALTIDAGSVVTGGGNIYEQDPAAVGTTGVNISPSSGSVIVDIGPDQFGSGLTNSYVVTTDNSATNGIIHYSPEKDGSTSGPTLVSEHVRLENINPQNYTKTSNYTVLLTEHQSTFNNSGAAGAVTFTLPTAVAGLEYTFYKVTNQQMDIAAGASDAFITGAAASDTTLSNVSNELGAIVRVRAISTAQWLVESISGTWA